MEIREKLSWEEIKKQYDKQWVELVDYDWPEGEIDPSAGVVRVHAKTRAEFDELTSKNPPQDSAYVFVGAPERPKLWTRGHHRIEIIPCNA